MKTDLISLKAALIQIDDTTNEAIERLWRERHYSSDFARSVVFCSEVKLDRSTFWAASVEVAWHFWAQAKDIVACPSKPGPSSITWREAQSLPSKMTDLNNGFVDLLKGTIIAEGVISGNKNSQRVCAIGEPLAVSSVELEMFCKYLEQWLDDVVCTPRKDGYSTDKNEPNYAEFREKLLPIKPKSVAQKRESWIAYVESFPNGGKPNRSERRAKYQELGFSHQEGEMLHKELSPPSWSSKKGKKMASFSK